MKRLVLITAFTALIASGCAKNKSSDETDFMAEDTESADTATVADDVAPEDQAAQQAEQPAPEVAQDNTAQDNTAQAEAAPEGNWTMASPQPEAAAPATAYGSGQVENYTVRTGDTLMKVAFNIYGDIEAWKQLYEMNRDVLSSAKALRVGQVIKYDKPVSAPTISQNGEPYLIRKGDTLGTISNEIYATPRKWRKLWENNRELVKDPNRIYAGFYLYYQITEEEKRMAESARSAGGATAAASSVATPSSLSEAPTSVGTTATNTAAPEAAPDVGGATNRDPAATQ